MSLPRRSPVLYRTLLVTCLLVVGGATRAQDKSVRPGINDNFQNPDAGQFTERFEREGRDAFDHRDQIVEACQLKPGMRVADVGAGTGLFTRLFATKVGEKGQVVAVDIAASFLDHIAATAKKDNLNNVATVRCTPTSVNLPPESVDLVFICDTYHHFEFPQKTMASIHRALRPGGQVVLIDFQRIEGVSSEFVMGHVRAGQEVFVKEILESGFRQVDEKKGMLRESYFVRFEKAGQDTGAWRPLFDGKSLDGWKVEGGYATYQVEAGAIVGTTADGSRNTFLCQGPFGDFELEFEVLCDKDLNSGVQIRSHVYEQDTPQASNPKRIREKGEVYGYQCEICEQSKGVSGNFWDEGRRTMWLDDLADKPGAATAYQDGQWNHYRIVARGDRIQSWVNGVACADFQDATDATGFIGLQVHGVKQGTGPYQVRWRNIRIRELK